MHRGQLERIIVELSELSEGRDWWRDGLVLKDPETACDLFLEAVTKEPYLEVRLRRGRQPEAFARVLGTLGKLLGRPPERTLVSVDGTTFVDLTAVVEARRAGEQEVTTSAGRRVPRAPYDRFASFAELSGSGRELVPEKPEGKPTRIFISCSHSDKDKAFLAELETQLRVLKRRFPTIVFWHRGQTLAGTAVADEIYRQLEVADIILLLISPDFMAPDRCLSDEMAHALKKYEAERGTPVPILLRPTAMWAEFEIGRHQALPRGGVPISKWGNSDEAWVNVTEGLLELLTKVQTR